MYLISYQKRNGDIFCRVRNTIPNCGIGGETSMGWKVVDIKYWFKNGFYSSSQHYKLYSKFKKRNHLKKIIFNIIKKYSTSIALLMLVPFFIK